MARQCTQSKRPRNVPWFKEKAMLAEVQESGQILDEEQLAFLVDLGIPDSQAAQTTIPNTAAFQTEDLDAYDSDCDDVSNAKAVLMANLSNYGSDIILEEKANQEKNNESLTAELERYKERVKTFKQRLNIDLSTREKMIDSQMDDMIKEKLALKQQIDSLEQNLSNQIKEKESLLQTFTVFKNESKEKESKYMDKEIDLEKKIKELDNIVYEVGQYAQTVHMLTKPQVFYDDTHKQALGYQNPFYLKKAQRIKPTLYDDFDKRFIPQQELSNEQAFWLQTSHPNTDQSTSSLVKMEAPKELHKTNSILKFTRKNFFLKTIDSYKKIMCQDVMICVMNSTAVFDDVNVEMQSSESCVKYLDLDAELLNKQNAYNDLSKKYFENNDLKAQLQVKDTTICKLKEHIKYMRENDKEEKVKHEMDEIETINIEFEHSVSMENVNLKCQIQDKVFVITSLKNDLQKLKGKEIVQNATQIPIATTIAPSMFKRDLDPLAPRLLNNIEARIDYLKHTQEQADIPRGIVKQAKATQPLDNALDFARLKCFTSTCRSQPTGNKKNDRISQKPSSNKKNKVEAQPRKVNKKNHVKEPICDVNVKHTMLNANSQLICVNCKQCIFDANHDVCFLDFVNDVNMHAKSNSKSKKNQLLNIWKPTGHMFIEIGYKWKPTRRHFTLVGNSCSLTRITPTKVVHLKETTSNPVETPKPEIKVYSRRPKQIKSVDVPSSSSLVNDRLSRLFSDLEDLETQNLYTVSLDDMLKTSPVCLLSKASKTKSWLWHRRLSHLNFGTLKKLAKDGLARGIPKLKFQKDHLCSACALGKSKKSSHQPKAEDTNQEKLYLLHMDLCGPMRVDSINGKKYILVIADNYS
ncbi:retrovirus-related pol polyprotein from transposon TNT 1-94 [Tanacetum coccineum]